MASIIDATTTAGVSVQGDNSGEIELQSNGTTALKVNTNEGIQILNCLGVGNATPSTSGAGITFPATQSDSTDANTLDDYEEGAWTPVLGGTTSETGQAYDRQAGRYVKVGRLVTCSFDVVLSTEGTVTGNAVIKGFPFVSGSDGASSGKGNRATLSIGSFSGIGTSVVFLGGYIGEGTTQVELSQLTTAATAPTGATGSTLFTDSTQIIGSITYITA